MKTLKPIFYKIYAFIFSFRHIVELYLSFKYMFNQKILTNKEHIGLASDWLLYMQNGDGGYSRKFSLVSGRDISYIETTGYIIPTLLDVANHLQDDRYQKSALRAGEWLLSIQNSDGSFSEIDYDKPYAFDTGQVLIGLNRLYKESNDSRYYEASKRASYWLAKNQEENGSWKRVAYNMQEHSYYSRVSSAMLEYAYISSDDYIKKQALKNIEWVLSNQNKNGFFSYASFLDTVPAYLHTIVYILEGLLDVYNLTKDKRVLEAVLKNSSRLKDINLNRDMILCSQYDENFNCVNKQKCITGLAQWAGVCLRLFEITGDEEYKYIAVTTLFYLKSKQIQEGKILKGALPASVPFWGRYGGFNFVNWGNKFYIDALLLLDKFKITTLQEQESYVGLAFRYNESVVNENLSLMDLAYLKHFDNYFAHLKDKPLKLLDLGCGKGRFLEYFKQNYPNWEIIGIEPTFEKKGEILKGSAYSIPLVDKSVDIIFTIEVLQHTYIDKALKEIKRVLKDNGYITIGDRNPYSILGVLKPIFEIRGRWMYPWDSPFRERWYSATKWKQILKKSSFKVKNIDIINNPNDKKVKFLNRYYFIIGEKSE